MVSREPSEPLQPEGGCSCIQPAASGAASASALPEAASLASLAAFQLGPAESCDRPCSSPSKAHVERGWPGVWSTASSHARQYHSPSREVPSHCRMLRSHGDLRKRLLPVRSPTMIRQLISVAGRSREAASALVVVVFL